jgi:hypothetical protein
VREKVVFKMYLYAIYTLRSKELSAMQQKALAVQPNAE